MRLQENLKKAVWVLDSEWFEQQKTRFVNHKHYNPILNKIMWEELRPVYNESRELISHQFEIEWEDNLEWFCWIDFGRIKNEEEGPFNPINSSDVTNNISKIIRQGIPLQDTVTAYRYLKVVIEYLEDSISELKKINNNSEYHSILDLFIANTGIRIWKEYDHIDELYKITTTSTDSCDFTLNEEQLIALLYLIWEAGFTKEEGRLGKSYLYTFWQKYFKYFDTSANEYSAVKNISKKFSDIKTAVNLKSLEEVFKNLEKAYNKTLALRG